MDLDTLVTRFPRLWHATFPKGWDGISRSGLRSSADLLAAAGRGPEARTMRPEPLAVSTPDGEAILRNQVPNRKDVGPDVDGMSIEDWWETINSRSYLFAVREDLDAMVDACVEAGVAQEVITFDTRRLLAPVFDHVDVSTVSATVYPRATGPSKGKATFRPIGEFTGLWSKVKEISLTVPVPVEDNAVVAVVSRAPGEGPARIWPSPRS